MYFMEQLLFFGFPAAVAVPLTVVFCRHQIAHGKPISFWQVGWSTLGAIPIYLVCVFGAEVFTSGFWTYAWHNELCPPAAFFLIVVGIPAFTCFASSTSVAAFYHRRGSKGKRMSRAADLWLTP